LNTTKDNNPLEGVTIKQFEVDSFKLHSYFQLCVTIARVHQTQRLSETVF